jgi:hypothetical protein
VRSQLMQVSVQKSTGTARRAAQQGVSGAELSHSVAQLGEGIVQRSERSHQAKRLEGRTNFL